MVAYSFHQVFVPQIEAGLKRQTIRGHRRRHARPGEPVQLYQGMRTRHCRKIFDPDPVCIGVEPVSILLKDGLVTVGMAGAPEILSIEIGGVVLDDDALVAFAIADGFDVTQWPDVSHTDLTGWRWAFSDAPAGAMAAWWQKMHRPGRFDGVLIRWEPQENGGGDAAP